MITEINIQNISDVGNNIDKRALTYFFQKKMVNVRSMVTSFIEKDQENVLVGTLDCEIYNLNLKNFKITLLTTCHTSSVYDLAFP